MEEAGQGSEEVRPERLQKVLARVGIGSRRSVEELITAGRVSVNGTPARLGMRVDPDNDQVQVDGSTVPLTTGLVHFLMNKPAGVVTTASDEHDRATVLDLIDAPRRVWPVGRLDVATEGALVVTNDGTLTHALTHPGFHVPKTYLARVGGAVRESELKRLRRGVELDDGPTAPAEAAVVDRGAGRTLVEVTISEGRNRQIRRMFEAIGHPVTALVRTAIGPLRLGRLKPGTFRRLAPAEVRELYRACGL